MPARVDRVVRRSENELGFGGGRMAAFGLFALAWMVLIGFRLYGLQVRQHEHFKLQAEDQQQTVVELHAPRGAILDAKGRELAVSVQVQSIYLNARETAETVDLGAAIEQLASTVGLSRQRLEELRRRATPTSTFVWVARKLDREVIERVKELNLPGVRFLEESRREYPLGSVGSHVLGYVGLDNTGLAGLEYRYNEEVTGRAAQRRVLQDARGVRYVAPFSLEQTPEPGTDLILTLDATLQHIAERELKAAVERHGALAGTLVLLDARDSAVLAMANVPDFDPNRFGTFDQNARRNRAVLDAYEPGSTFKMVTAAAAFDSLRVRPDDRFDCEDGAITVDGQRIRDHKPFGVLSFRDAIAVSSNVCTIKAGMRVGAKPLREAVLDFGFGSATGIDLAGENKGKVHGLNSWSKLNAAYHSFGHGLSASPIQLANAYAALASGSLNQPFLVRGFREGDEIATVPRPAARKLNLNPATRMDLIRVLEGVVQTGTGKRAAIPGYRVAGKTGTAEKSTDQGYSDTGRLSSFVGMAPAGRPRLVAVVMIDEPRRIKGGGEVAAPVFRDVVEDALLYLGVRPDRDAWDRREDFIALKRDRPQSPEQESAAEAAVKVASLRVGQGSDWQ